MSFRSRARPAPAPGAAGAGADGLLAGRARHGHVLPSVQESADLALAVAAVAAGGAGRRQLAAPPPPGVGLSGYPTHCGNPGRGQQAYVLPFTRYYHGVSPLTPGWDACYRYGSNETLNIS